MFPKKIYYLVRHNIAHTKFLIHQALLQNLFPLSLANYNILLTMNNEEPQKQKQSLKSEPGEKEIKNWKIFNEGINEHWSDEENIPSDDSLLFSSDENENEKNGSESSDDDYFFPEKDKESKDDIENKL